MLRPWFLLLLRTRPQHAYSLMAELHRFGLATPDWPTLYRLLHDLETAGLVRSVWAPGDGGPERRVYRVTGAGTRQLRRDAQALRELSADLSRFDAEWRQLEKRLARRRH